MEVLLTLRRYHCFLFFIDWFCTRVFLHSVFWRFGFFDLWVVMASKQGSKSRKAGSSNLKAADSTASSTTSSSKFYQETSIDGHSSPASSSAQSKQHFFSPDSFPQSAQRSKENVTVTVRFRPLRFLVICFYRLAK